MRAAQGASMGDACKIGVLSETVSGGHVSESYVYGSEIACGFDMAPRGESRDGAQAGVTPAVVRLPIGTAITSQSRVQITKRNGETITPQYYSVEGDPGRGPTAIRANLVRVVGSRRG
jgi:hypothetical protein